MNIIYYTMYLDSKLKGWCSKMNRKNLEYVKMKNDVALESTVRRLKQELSSLKTQVDSIIEDIDKRGSEASINGLGIVQAQGGSIDSLCGKLLALKDIKEMLEILDKE